MLCFHGPLLDENRDSLRCLTEQGLLSKDKFKGGYTLTKAGFAAMQQSQGEAESAVLVSLSKLKNVQLSTRSQYSPTFPTGNTRTRVE